MREHEREQIIGHRIVRRDRAQQLLPPQHRQRSAADNFAHVGRDRHRWRTVQIKITGLRCRDRVGGSSPGTTDASRTWVYVITARMILRPGDR